jgi:hypothetical protein
MHALYEVETVMMKRFIVLGTLAFVCSSSAFAQDVKPSETSRDMQKMADTLNNPVVQDAMVKGIDGLLGAMLDMRIDGLAKALEPLNNGKKIKIKDKTIREMAERDDPRFEEKMHKGTKAMASGMGALASAMATMLPQLEAAMDKIDDEVERIERSLPEKIN